MTSVTRLRLLTFLLRLGGVVTFSAFFAMLLPIEWMASTHRWLGMGEFPRSAVVDYLARSIAALYGFHGILLLIIARDPVRYRTIVWYVVFMDFAFGVMVLLIDLHAGMPVLWTIGEGPPIIVLGMAIAFLNRENEDRR